MNEDPLLESGLTKLSNASGVSYSIFYNHSILFETWPTSFHAPSFFLDCLKWNLNCQFLLILNLKKLFNVNTFIQNTDMNRWVEQTLAANYHLKHTLCRIVMHADSNCNLLFHFKTIFLKWLRFILTDLRFQVMWCLSIKNPFCTRNLTTNQLYYKLQITTSFRNNSTRYLNEKKGEFSMCVC